MLKPEPILIEVTFPVPAEKIWQALTDKNEMQHWYFELLEFKPEPGFEFQFEGGDANKTFLHVCRVTEAVPNQKLAYSWRYAGFEGDTLVSFTLISEGENTRLKLMHEGLETFPETEPALARQNFEAGWQHILGTSLKNYLEKETVPNQ